MVAAHNAPGTGQPSTAMVIGLHTAAKTVHTLFLHLADLLSFWIPKGDYDNSAFDLLVFGDFLVLILVIFDRCRKRPVI